MFRKVVSIGLQKNSSSKNGVCKWKEGSVSSSTKSVRFAMTCSDASAQVIAALCTASQLQQNTVRFFLRRQLLYAHFFPRFIVICRKIWSAFDACSRVHYVSDRLLCNKKKLCFKQYMYCQLIMEDPPSCVCQFAFDKQANRPSSFQKNQHINEFSQPIFLAREISAKLEAVEMEKVCN